MRPLTCRSSRGRYDGAVGVGGGLLRGRIRGTAKSGLDHLDDSQRFAPASNMEQQRLHLTWLTFPVPQLRLEADPSVQALCPSGSAR